MRIGLSLRERVLPEVRRLRESIVGLATLHPSMDTVDEDGRDYEQGICLWCGRGLQEGSCEKSHTPECAWVAARDEAEAIRAERSPAAGAGRG